jgi:hypothetical protein
LAEGEQTRSEKSDTRISLPASYQEVEDITRLAGGKRKISNYLRGLILKDATERGISLQENSFAFRSGGYDAVGEERKGGKETASLIVTANNAILAV